MTVEDPAPDGSPSAGRPFVLVALVLAAALVFVGVLALIALRGGALFAPAASGQDTTPRAAVAASTLSPATVNRFDAPRAYRLTALQVAAGQRPAGSPQLVKLARTLKRDLPSARFESLPDSRPGKRLRNIVATLPGRRPGVVVGAHYDTLVKPDGFVGANNGAAGSAIVIEVARAMRKLKRPRGARELTFVLFDGEEPDAGLPEDETDFYHAGLRGSRAYVARHPGGTGRMLLLDYVGNRGLSLPREGSSDRGVWRDVRRAARQVGVGAVFPDRTDVTIQDDHTPFLRAGAPAADFIDWSYPGHTLQDSMKQIDRRALDAVGETVVQYLRTAR